LVGRLGANAVASVSILFPIIFLIISLGGGLAIAGTVLVSQFKGKKSKIAINHIATQTLILVITIAIILSVLGYITTPILIKLMGAGKDIVLDSISYVRISFIGLTFMFIYIVFQSVLLFVYRTHKILIYAHLNTECSLVEMFK